MASPYKRVGRIVASTLFALALVAAPAAAGADQPTRSNTPEMTEQGEPATQEPAQHEGESSRDQPMLLGKDYVMGRFILPLVIGIAAAFALVLIVVLRPSEPDSEQNRAPRKHGG